MFIDKGMQCFKKIYSVVMKLIDFFCPPLFRKRPIHRVYIDLLAVWLGPIQ